MGKNVLAEKYCLNPQFYLCYNCPHSWAHNRKNLHTGSIKQLYQSGQAKRDEGEEVTENSHCKAAFSACVCTKNWLLPPTPPEGTSCGTQCRKPTAHKDSLRPGTSATSLLPLSLPFSTTENQGGQGLVLTHSLNADSRYSEVGAPRNKVSEFRPPPTHESLCGDKSTCRTIGESY